MCRNYFANNRECFFGIIDEGKKLTSFRGVTCNVETVSSKLLPEKQIGCKIKIGKGYCSKHLR